MTLGNLINTEPVPQTMVVVDGARDDEQGEHLTPGAGLLTKDPLFL